MYTAYVGFDIIVEKMNCEFRWSVIAGLLEQLDMYCITQKTQIGQDNE